MRKGFLRIAGILLIVAGAVVALTSALVVNILPEVFSSTVRINSRPAMTDAVQLDREMEKIQSKTVLGQVSTNLNLQKRWAEKLKVDQLSLDLVETLLRKNMEVRLTRGTALIAITVFSEDRVEAANIANEIAKTYRDISRGAEGKPAVEIIDPAQPGLRPVRPNKIVSIGIAWAMGAALVVVGVLLMILASGQRNRPAMAS